MTAPCSRDKRAPPSALTGTGESDQLQKGVDPPPTPTRTQKRRYKRQTFRPLSFGLSRSLFNNPNTDTWTKIPQPAGGLKPPNKQGSTAPQCSTFFQ